jgi:ankyrin repeat protein
LLLRASHQHDANAALEVALCYAYGIGTEASWPGSLEWLKKAASRDNAVGAMYLKRLKPELENVKMEKEDGKTYGLNALILAGYLHMYKLGKGYEDLALEFYETLRDAYPELYEKLHSIARYCCCKAPDSPLTEAHVGLAKNPRGVLNYLWDHFGEIPEDSEPDMTNIHGIMQAGITSYIGYLCKQIDTVDGEGTTLLHVLATCRHPRDDRSGKILRICNFLADNGCPLDVPDQSGETALSAALQARNYEVAEFLLGRGIQLEEPWNVLMRLAAAHDFKALELLLPIADNNVDGLDRTPRFQKLFIAVCYPYLPERRMKHGDDYLEVGRKTLSYLFRYALDHGVALGDCLQNCLRTLLWSGSNDLLLQVLQQLAKIDSSSVSEKINSSFLLHRSISCHQADIFRMLLDLGADPNQTDDNGAYPLSYSSVYITREPTFFYLLLEKGADLDAMADGGVDLLLMIIALEENGQATRHLLKKKPALLQAKPGRHQSSLLGYAIMMGCPGTVSAILDAGAKVTNLEFGALSMLDCAAGSSTRYSIETLKVLLAHEGTNSQTMDRLSRALCLACQSGNPAGIQFLLQSGADPNYVPTDSSKLLPPPIVGAWVRLRHQRKAKSTTPHQLAVEERDFQAVRQILKQHGLDESRFVLDDAAYENFQRTR